jgi:hypothetical protein
MKYVTHCTHHSVLDESGSLTDKLCRLLRSTVINLEIGSHATCRKELNRTYNKCLSTLNGAMFHCKTYGSSGMHNASPSSPSLAGLVSDYSTTLHLTNLYFGTRCTCTLKEGAYFSSLLVQSDLDTDVL